MGGVEEWLRVNGWADARAEPLSGGMISRTTRLTRHDGATVVIKQAVEAPPGLFGAEARGLAALRTSGAVPVPAVITFDDDHLVLTDLGGAAPDEPDWAELGGDVARLHLITSDRHGWPEDNFLGRLPQRNRPDPDGYRFFAEQRLVRYLPEPLVTAALTRQDRARIERLADRLPELVPAQPASLLHGDLWYGNVIGSGSGSGIGTGQERVAVVDPATHHGWAEAELSMLWCCGRVPEVFWRAYQQVRPLEAGWRQRMPLLHLREQLSVLAHFGDRYGTAAEVRATLARY